MIPFCFTEVTFYIEVCYQRNAEEENGRNHMTTATHEIEPLHHSKKLSYAEIPLSSSFVITKN